jgi:hypothetical protein
MARRLCGVQLIWLSSRERTSDSSSCTSFRKSRAMGRNSGGAGGDDSGRRNRPSPRISARMPCTQPRQDSCAMATVSREMTIASPAKK